ncbi:hypothetical protein EIN_026460 [Entamoeba invadens IP1]|uniref:hypothetical protein n=1 Tax=Entamoeba invadens IP1 TaxID=370355 RepID=UPI0002C3D1F4|nr:hypothetical protein EIN_026460 [Entamoeba invadens IP1]ELP90787.1 hypothetical protein EIN_026460 [Entamoeba invadens IP1]|eukprot:XP_004257558.1 hypothetical protein EIN_026460 [Entamoeba invadens IP1]
MSDSANIVAQPKPFRAVPCQPKPLKIDQQDVQPSDQLSESNSMSSFTDEEVKNLLLFKETPASNGSTNATPNGRDLYTPPNRCENPDISESVFEQSASIAINSPVQEFTGCGLTDLSPPQYSQIARGFSGW